MKRCPKCGAELDDQVRFCYQCGEMLGAGDSGEEPLTL